MKRHFFTLTFSVFLLLNVHTVFAQDLDDGVIHGTVFDPVGAAVPGALVSASRGETVVRSLKTDRSGRFRFVDLDPGVYRIEVTAAGFARTVLSGIQLSSGRSVHISPLLAVGSVKLEVSVEDPGDGKPDVTRTVVGGSFGEHDVSSLPNPTGDVLDLVFLLQGIDEEPFSIKGLADDDRIGSGSDRDRPSEVTGAGSYSLSGGAAYSTNLTIDGFDNNDDRAASERFQPPADSVAEVQVVSNQFSAEYGRASGGRINIRTKTGASRFRGRIFCGFEDETLNANTYNNNRRGLGKLPYTRIDPGGSVTGPVPFAGGNNAFFFSFQEQRRLADSLIDTVVPADTNPDFPLPPPTEPDERRVDDIPNPQTDSFPAVDIAPYRAIVPTPSVNRRLLARIDQPLGRSGSLAVSYQMGRSSDLRQYRESTRYLEETLQARERDTDAVNARHDLVIGSRGVNQARIQYSRYRPAYKASASADPVVLLFVSDDSRAGRDDQVRGTVVIGNSTANFANARSEDRLQVQDSLTLLYGRHTFRAGVDLQYVRSETSDLADSTGTFNFARVYDFLVGKPSRFRRNFGGTSVQKNLYTAIFTQFETSPANGLTLIGGLRWELESLVSDTDNFGPRLAAAWAPWKDAKTVFRIGAGVFFNRVLLRTLDDYTLGAQAVRFDSESLAGPSNEARCLDRTDPGGDRLTDKCRFLEALAPGFPAAPSLDNLRQMLTDLGISDGGFVTETSFSRLVEKGIEVPESYQFNAGVERDMGHGFSLEVNVTWNKAARLWRETNVNAFQIPEGFATMTDYLLSLGTIPVGGTLTRFEMGDPSDISGVGTSGGVRVVNLRTLNGSEARGAPIGIAYRALEETLQRPYDPALGQVEMVSDAGKSIYRGFSVMLKGKTERLPFGSAGSFRISYTLSRTEDDGFVDTSSAQSPGDFASEFSLSGIDRRHRFRASGIFDLPHWLGKIVFAPALRLESARPFNIGIGGSDRNLDDVSNDRPDFSGRTGDIRFRGPDDPYPAFLASRFSLAPIGTPGNLPRNAGRGPALFTFDASFAREFRFGERVRVRPRVDVTNILNAKVFSFGSDYIDLSDSGGAEFQRGFLVPSRTLRQRRVSLGIRIEL